jgi:hypothetical protein
MSLELPNSSDSYLRSDEVYVDSTTDKGNALDTDFTYTVVLKQIFQQMIGLQLTSWDIPYDIAPSFYPAGLRVTGINSVDFQLENPDIQVGRQLFSMTWPTKYYTYTNTTNPEADYNVTLARLMNDAISTRLLWDGRVEVGTFRHPLGNTILTINTVDNTLPLGSTTEMKLLFLTGASTDSAANVQMGFPVKADYTSSPSTFYSGSTEQSIQSPDTTVLRPFPYVDISVDQADKTPVRRIFLESNQYTRVDSATSSFNELRISTQDTTRRLQRLNIKIRYPNGANPENYVSSAIPHKLGFTVISLSGEVAAIPGYVNQNIVY